MRRREQESSQIKTALKIFLGILIGISLTLVGLYVVAVVFVLPQFKSDAAETVFNGTASAIEIDINLFNTEQIVNGCTHDCFPKELDKQEDGPCKTCFSGLSNDFQNNLSHWSKAGLTYTYSNGDVKKSFTYNPTTGKLIY